MEERSYFAMLALLHLPQIILRIEILNYATVQSLIDGRTERGHLLLPVFQEPEAATDNFAGIVVTPAFDACLDKLFEMRTQCD